MEVPRELEPWLPAPGWSGAEADALLLPVIDMDVGQLVWQLDLPFWAGRDGQPFQVRPLDVVDGPHLELVEREDCTLPLDVTWQNGRWIVLDGLHRLLKAARGGLTVLPARVVPPEAIRQLAA